MRKYQWLWEKIKTDGMLSIKLSFDEDCGHQQLYKRIQKAIKKEKSGDYDFKELYPSARLKFAKFDIQKNSFSMKIVLTYHTSIKVLEEF